MKIKLIKILGQFHIKAANFRSSAKDMWTERIALWPILISGLFILLAWLGAFLIVRTVGDNLAILHYNVIFGVDLIGDVRRVLFMPAFSSLVFCLNLFLAIALFGKKDKLAANLLMYSSLAVNVLTFMGLYFLYMINLS